MKNEQNKKILKRRNVVIVIVIILLLSCGIAAGLIYNSWFIKAVNNFHQTKETVTDSSSLPIDPNGGDYTEPSTSQSPGSGIAIPGWGSITIPSEKADVTVNFTNPDANAGKYYLTFQLVLENSGEVLYTSGLVPPGKVIQKITLSRALEAGTYDAIVKVQPYKMNNEKTPTNNADMKTKLIVG